MFRMDIAQNAVFPPIQDLSSRAKCALPFQTGWKDIQILANRIVGGWKSESRWLSSAVPRPSL